LGKKKTLKEDKTSAKTKEKQTLERRISKEYGTKLIGQKHQEGTT